jgi:hypothetical protein
MVLDTRKARSVELCVTAALFETEPARPQLVLFRDDFRQVDYRARQMRISSEEGAHHVAVTPTNVAPGGNRREVVIAQRFERPPRLNRRKPRYGWAKNCTLTVRIGARVVERLLEHVPQFLDHETNARLGSLEKASGSRAGFAG